MGHSSRSVIHDALEQIRAGQSITLIEPVWTPIGFAALGALVALCGFAVGNIGFWLGWWVLGFGALMIFGGVAGLLAGRPRLAIDAAGFTIEQRNERHPWSTVSRFFVTTGDAGDRWVSFRSTELKPSTSGVLGALEAKANPLGNLDLGSRYGMSVERLAEFMNALRDELAPSQQLAADRDLAGDK